MERLRWKKRMGKETHRDKRMTEWNGEKVGGEAGDEAETGRRGCGERDEKKRWGEWGGETGKGEGRKGKL